MKLKLFHKLFLLVALTALVAALAMASVMAWNLSRGFAGYLEARDVEMIDAYTGVISQQLEERGGAEALTARQITLKTVHADLVREGLLASRGPDFRTERHPSDRPDRPLFGDGPSSRPPPPPKGDGPPSFLAPRLLLFDASGEQIDGPPLPPTSPLGGPKMLERQIVFGGEIIGTVKMIPPGPSPDGVNARFLRDQYVNAALLVAALMVFAGLSAWGFARAGTRRMADLEGATKEIANGNFDIRTEVAGTDEISTMGLNINQMAESLARADQARRGWLAEIGHELRTPLTVLSGELEALKDGIRPLNQKAVDSLLEETGRLGNLIEDLHFMAVSDLTNAPNSFSANDAVKLVGDVTARFKPLLSQAGLSLKIDLGKKATIKVVWDGKRVDQLLGNLLTNALRYTDAPGLVKVRLKNTKELVTISVEDSAPGVPDDALPRLFEPLFRVDDARDRASGGSGLGLSVCKAIAEAHGGRISANVSKSGGLLIEVNLPVEAPPHD